MTFLLEISSKIHLKMTKQYNMSFTSIISSQFPIKFINQSFFLKDCQLPFLELSFESIIRVYASSNWLDKFKCLAILQFFGFHDIRNDKSGTSWSSSSTMNKYIVIIFCNSFVDPFTKSLEVIIHVLLIQISNRNIFV